MSTFSLELLRTALQRLSLTEAELLSIYPPLGLIITRQRRLDNYDDIAGKMEALFEQYGGPPRLTVRLVDGTSEFLSEADQIDRLVGSGQIIEEDRERLQRDLAALRECWWYTGPDHLHRRIGQLRDQQVRATKRALLAPDVDLATSLAKSIILFCSTEESTSAEALMTIAITLRSALNESLPRKRRLNQLADNFGFPALKLVLTATRRFFSGRPHGQQFQPAPSRRADTAPLHH